MTRRGVDLLPPELSQMEQTAARNPNAPSMVFRDGLGIRCRLVRTDGIIEVLCVPHELSEAPSFESALRARVDELRNFAHPSLTRIRSLERLKDPKRTLALISSDVPGIRVSDLLTRAAERQVELDVSAALSLIDQLTTAIAALHENKPVAHGAIAPERLILAPDGTLILAEYVFGSALAELRYSRERYWKELHIPSASDFAAPAFDQAGDLRQLGVIADELFTVQAILPAPIRTWLTRVLGLEPQAAFPSAHAARAELTAALTAVEPKPSARALADFYARCGGDDIATTTVATAVAAASPQPAPVQPSSVQPPSVQPSHDSAASVDADEPSFEAGSQTDDAVAELRVAQRGHSQPQWRRLSIAAALVAMSAAGFAAVHYRGSSQALPVSVVADLRSSQNIDLSPTLPAPIVQDVQALSATPPLAQATTPPTAVSERPVSSTAPASDASGWISVSAPKPVQILENGVRVGASDSGRVKLSVGAHQIEIVNADLGYRSARNVTVAAGRTSTIKIAFPNGSMALNAVPWAEVWVDGEKVGETPIADLSIAAGAHDVVFRHPDLGERRRTVVVTLSEPVRLGVDMREQ